MVKLPKKITMSLKENKALICRLVEELQNQHRLDAVDELLHPDFVDHAGSRPSSFLNSREGVKGYFASVFDAFPDLHATIHDQVAEGDLVVTRKVFRATHQGDFMGIAATGRTVEWNVIDIMSVVDGKIKDHWSSADRLSLMQQLGIVPS